MTAAVSLGLLGLALIVIGILGLVFIWLPLKVSRAVTCQHEDDKDHELGENPL